MLKKIFLLLSCCLLNLKGNALEISFQDSAVLETFFRETIEHYLYGYVLYGEKPVCIDGYNIANSYSKRDKFHKLAVISREGALAWERITKKFPCENVLIHNYKNVDSVVHNVKYILFINKKLFLQTVADNIILFQYILGPTITPQKLLEKLTDPDETFSSVLNNNKTLIGIILGYGTQNALYVSRCENIAEHITSTEFPPFASPLFQNGKPVLNHIKLEALLFSKIEPSYALKDPKPSLGYTTLKDEFHDLNSKIITSSEKLLNKKPQFIFGHLKDDTNDKLLLKLEKTQEKIEQLLKSKTFLTDVLKLIYPNQAIIIHTSPAVDNPLPFEKSELEQLPFIIALEIWKQLSGKNPNTINSFIDGMHDAEHNIPRNLSNEDIVYCEKYKALKEIHENLITSEKYFQELISDINFRSIIPNKLYYKTIQEGSGEPLTTQNKVVLHYSITTPTNKIYADTWYQGIPQNLSLSDTISGFAWGIKGMKVGEIREVVIHPSLGYGIYTLLDKGTYLKAVIELIRYSDDEDGNKFPELSSLNLEFNFDLGVNGDLKFIEKEKNIAAAYGYENWKHYKQIKWVTLPQVVSWLEKFKASDQSIIPQSDHDQLINQVHWHIYRNKIKTKSELRQATKTAHKVKISGCQACQDK